MTALTPEEDILANCMVGRLRMITRLVSQKFEKALKAYGLKAGQLTLLALVAKYQPITASALTQLSVLQKSTLSRELAVLSKHNLVLMQDNGTQKKPVVLTEKGRELLNNIWPFWQQAHKSLQQQLGLEAEQSIHMILKTLNV
jgi:DNA-binding MarR family transcriptional regulator